MAIYRNISLSFWEDNKVVDDFTPEDRVKFEIMRKSGIYGFDSAREELIAGKILKRISELVNTVEKIKWHLKGNP